MLSIDRCCLRFAKRRRLGRIQVAGFEVLKGVRGWRPNRDDYRPRKWRLDASDNTEDPVEGDDTEYIAEYPIEDDNAEHSAANEYLPADDSLLPMNAAIVHLEDEPDRSPLDEIADALRTLTYGEMMELAASMWNVKPDGSSLTEHNLPAVLYRWSTSRQL